MADHARGTGVIATARVAGRDVERKRSRRRVRGGRRAPWLGLKVNGDMHLEPFPEIPKAAVLRGNCLSLQVGCLLFPDCDSRCEIPMKGRIAITDSASCLWIQLNQPVPKGLRDSEKAMRIKLDMRITLRVNITRKWCDQSLVLLDQSHGAGSKEHPGSAVLYCGIPGAFLEHGKPAGLQSRSRAYGEVGLSKSCDQGGTGFDVMRIL